MVPSVFQGDGQGWHTKGGKFMPKVVVFVIIVLVIVLIYNIALHVTVKRGTIGARLDREFRRIARKYRKNTM
jgi:hypothetical protein